MTPTAHIMARIIAMVIAVLWVAVLILTIWDDVEESRELPYPEGSPHDNT